MKTYRVILKPEGRISQFPSSDTIFGALCWGIRHLYSDINLGKVLQEFHNWDRRFIPSSAFPVIQTDQGLIFCYPKPLFADSKIAEIDQLTERYKAMIVDDAREKKIEVSDELQYAKMIIINTGKGIKKAKYLTESVFQQIVSASNTMVLLTGLLEGKIKMLAKVLLTAEEYQLLKRETLWTEMVSMRNKIDRVSFATVPGGELYYEYEIYLNPAITELYFLLFAEDINFLKPVFRWLEDTGIGGNRTTGAGHYSIKIEGEFSLPDTNGSHTFISLSKYLPKENEINWESSENRYELLPYQSRFDTLWFKGGEFLKQRVTYITEGSILQARQRQEYYGALYPAGSYQGNTIYQCGLTIPIFIKRR